MTSFLSVMTWNTGSGLCSDNRWERSEKTYMIPPHQPDDSPYDDLLHELAFVHMVARFG